MVLYLTIIKRSFQQRFIYRFNSYFSIFSGIIRLFVMFSIWSVLYSGKTEVNGITLNDMIVFVSVNVLVTALTGSNIHNEIGARIRDGSLSLDFIKPINFKWQLFSNQIGENLFKLIFHSIPALLFILIFWRVEFQVSLQSNLLFLCSLACGIIIYFQISYILGVCVFWLKSSFFIDWVSTAMMRIFAGSFVPLWFYPDVLLAVCKVLPFRFITFEPISIYLGKTSIHDAWNIIAMQVVWIILLLAAEKIIWSRGQYIIDINGG